MKPVHEVILDEVILLHPEDSKTNVCIPFSLKKDYRSLEIICSYEPKNCDDNEKAKEMILEGLETYVPPEYREQCEPWEIFLPSVVSLITFSLDSPGKYLGCAHRHAPEQRHFISGDFSSPGFFRHFPRPGGWRAVINVHAVVSSEVAYHLQIFGNGGED
jgi:hypothetical protein